MTAQSILATRRKTIAFAFDIDGVLIKGKQPVPGAREALRKLQEQHIPFIFLTNGGGLTEAAHIRRLELRLGLDFSVKQLVQSHTPFYDLVPLYAKKPVLVLGGHEQQIRDVAHAYGFEHVLTSSDFFVDYPHIHPFSEMTCVHHSTHGRSHNERGHGIQGEELKDTRIAAIMVWSSPRDWCLDLQLIKDLLLSERGKVGTRSTKNGDPSLENHGYQRDDQPKLYFSNPDFAWATQHELPRLAQGAFRAALEGIWTEETHGRARLEYSIVGKPTNLTYEYAEKALVRHYEHVLSSSAKEADIGTVYMVSVLVETGVHVAGTTPMHMPTHLTRDVGEAVDWALGVNGLGEAETKGLDGSLAEVGQNEGMDM
ncbi:HAD-superfamily hydrolase [Xylariaceae sp. FL1651]|nr:HAD-superfamily hydrolase [Xylariaceae sp. FL1651]